MSSSVTGTPAGGGWDHDDLDLGDDDLDLGPAAATTAATGITPCTVRLYVCSAVCSGQLQLLQVVLRAVLQEILL